ncbi:hypothetical protein ACNOYE_02815 [Nannocystaceae bacterium ST9]
MLAHSRLASFALCLLLVPACKRDPTTPPDDQAGEGSEGEGGGEVAPPEQEGSAPAITCERPEQFGPVIVSAEQFATRHAATATKFSAVASSKEQPAEVCGIAAGVELLVSLTCDDGTNPFAGDWNAAHSSRAGNVGPGGRCGSIIDRYVVACPEGSFDVYIDAYICADAAAFQ